MELINLKTYPVSDVLDRLLRDKTTKRNIIFATKDYSLNGNPIEPSDEITSKTLLAFDDNIIQPRVFKSLQTQKNRKKAMAEVFTPSWVVDKMVNHIDFEWFGKDVFNIRDGTTWKVIKRKVPFTKGRTWEDYIMSTRLEITCGEAPYLVSRYDTTTGEPIPVKSRIGILDRKLRVVNENTDDLETWLKWVYKAYQATYGYEYQGDNLLIARINFLLTFVEYMQDHWGMLPTKDELRKVTNIITWNLWQMDGLSGTIPCNVAPKKYEVIELDLFDDEKTDKEKAEKLPPCRIYDWKANKSVDYNSLKYK